MSTRVSLRRFAAAAAFAVAGSTVATVHAKSIDGIECQKPPIAHCGDACTVTELRNPGNATDAKTGRKYFLDYPCDLQPNEKVIFILNIHGAGSSGSWQRHYFPALDYVDKYRLVVATPTAAGGGSLGGDSSRPATRMWMANADDAHLQNIVDFVFEQFGQKNIKSFWLAGHSQGGMTSNRLVCTDFFKDKVDGWLSLSGGRIGRVQIPEGFFAQRPNTTSSSGAAPATPRAAPGGGQPGAANTPSCDFNYIFTTGEHEMVSLPDTSPWAEKYACKARDRKDDIVDTKAGYVSGGNRGGQPNKAWGLAARPGTAEVFVYPKCKDKKLVADVVRMDKGHTEGLEPKVTESLIKMIAAAPGGKVQKLK
jgi:hypothetical protein